MTEFVLPESPKQTELQKRISLMAKHNIQLKKCHATIMSGYPCRCKAMSSEVFCHAHLMQGFGLFTLAVLSQLEVSLRSGGNKPK